MCFGVSALVSRAGPPHTLGRCSRVGICFGDVPELGFALGCLHWTHTHSGEMFQSFGMCFGLSGCPHTPWGDVPEFWDVLWRCSRAGTCFGDVPELLWDVCTGPTHPGEMFPEFWDVLWRVCIGVPTDPREMFQSFGICFEVSALDPHTPWGDVSRVLGCALEMFQSWDLLWGVCTGVHTHLGEMFQSFGMCFGLSALVSTELGHVLEMFQSFGMCFEVSELVSTHTLGRCFQSFGICFGLSALVSTHTLGRCSRAGMCFGGVPEFWDVLWAVWVSTHTLGRCFQSFGMCFEVSALVSTHTLGRCSRVLGCALGCLGVHRHPREMFQSWDLLWAACTGPTHTLERCSTVLGCALGYQLDPHTPRGDVPEFWDVLWAVWVSPNTLGRCSRAGICFEVSALVSPQTPGRCSRVLGCALGFLGVHTKPGEMF
nr:uncharacterized protein LOC115498416 [Taeniopygia guttata]